MDLRSKAQPFSHCTIMSLVFEYEVMSQKGTVGFYEEAVFLALIEHYQNDEKYDKK